MTYDEALILKQQKSNLIGTIDNKGFIIGDIFIVPADETLRDEFFRSYFWSCDAELAIKSFLDESMEVWAIDTKHLLESNVLFYRKLG